MLAVPTRGQIEWGTVTRLEEIQRTYKIDEPIVYQPGNLSVAQTRNLIVERFMETACDVLVMVDDDIIPPVRCLDAITELCKPGEEWGVLCVPHPFVVKGGIELGIFDKADDGDGYVLAQPISGVNECDAVATGCIMIRRQVLDHDRWRMHVPIFQISDDPRADVTSDDFLFCQYVQACGYRVGYVLNGEACDHHRIVGLGHLYEAHRRSVHA